MKENEIAVLYSEHPVISGLIESAGNPEIQRIAVAGVYGSAKALALARTFITTQITHIVVIPEK